MNRSLPEAILDQLASTRAEALPGARWRCFSEREWKQALMWLDLSGLAIYFHDEMKRSNGLDALPDGARRSLERRRADNRLRTVRIAEELAALCTSFAQARVRYAVLKGLALVPDYCSDPALRTQYDHDVLLDSASLAAAAVVMEKAGYRRKNTEGASVVVYRPPEPAIRFAETSEGLYSPLLGRSVEAHLTLWEESEDNIRVALPGDFLDRARRRRWDGIEFVALCDEDSLVFQILHAFRHILRNWCRLSIFLEIGRFVDRRAADSAFWKAFTDRIEGIRWAREASLVVFTLAERLFSARVPPQLRQSLTTRLSPALDLWIERYGRRAALSNFHGDKCSLFLHEEFVDSPSEWAAIRRRRLFPVQRPHRPPATLFQRGFSTTGKVWMESAHALRRIRFHGLANLRYALEYPRWIQLRRMRLDAESGGG